MKLLLWFVAACAVLLPRVSNAQALNPGEWRSYTSMRAVQSMVLSPDSIHVWSVTSGGAFRANIRDTSEPLLVLRTTDGLTENDLVSVAADSKGNIFFGGRSGGFDIYRASTGLVERLGSDITTSDHPSKTINGISTSGDTVFLATAYGIGVYRNLQPGYFALTVGSIASLPPSDSVEQVVNYAGYVYAAMREGVAFASNKIDLYSNANWTVLRDTGGSVRSLAIFGGKLYAGATNGLFMVSANHQSLVPISLPSSTVVVQLTATTDSLYLLDISGNVFSTNDLLHFAVQNYTGVLGGRPTSIAALPKSQIGIGTATNGFALSSRNQLHTGIYPPGPISNQVASISYASAKDELLVSNADFGINIFTPSPEAWETFESGVGTTPHGGFGALTYDSTRDLIWVGYSGAGFYNVKDLGSTNPTWTLFPVGSAGIPRFQTAGDFMVAPGGIVENKGRFIMTTWAENGRGLSITSDGKNFESYALNDPTPDFGLPYGCVTEDLEGNYWVGTIRHDSPKSYGVFWLRSTDNAHGSIPGGQGLLLDNPAVNAILTDQDDGIWCGTESGVQIIANPYTINDASPKFSIRKVSLLASQIVHSMAVDGVGNKWIGTENGIFVVSPDGSDSVAHFTKENSPLIDNTALSLAIDTKRGEAYAGTFSGISRFSTIFKQGKSDYAGIHVFPNPVVQNSDESPLIHIDGLVAGSTVKVFTLNGKLVAAINGTNLGSTVVWSGRDDRGRQVPSGIYIISATSPQSGENGQAKVVIVRKP